MKRQSSVDEVFNTSAALTKPASAFHMNATPPVSRSYSMPTANSSPHPPIKIEPFTQSFPNTKPLTSTPANPSRTFSTPRSSTSELISLLSSDDFTAPGAIRSDLSAENQFDFNGSLKSLSSMSSAPAGRTSAAAMDWSNSSSVDMGVDWETSSTMPDDLRQKSAASKGSHMMRNSLTSAGVKTELTMVHDGATAGLVAAHDKQQITVKFSRRTVSYTHLTLPTIYSV